MLGLLLLLRPQLPFGTAERHKRSADEYQGQAAIGAFLSDRTVRRGAPLLVPTRANTQPAFGVYFPTPKTEIARPYAILVLTLQGEQISAITWFGESSVFPQFGLPRTLRCRER